MQPNTESVQQSATTARSHQSNSTCLSALSQSPTDWLQLQMKQPLSPCYRTGFLPHLGSDFRAKASVLKTGSEKHVSHSCSQNKNDAAERDTCDLVPTAGTIRSLPETLTCPTQTVHLENSLRKGGPQSTTSAAMKCSNTRGTQPVTLHNMMRIFLPVVAILHAANGSGRGAARGLE